MPARCVALLLLAVSCGSHENVPTPTPAPAPAAPTPRAPAAAPAADPNEASAAQIVVTYTGADPGDPSVHRTKEEAATRAGALLARIRAGEAFDAVARSDSDHRSKARGGLIGTFRRSEIPPAMAEAIFALGVGDVSPAPVETPAGYHLFRRLPVEKIHARHILIRYHGARNDHGATRSKEEARALAEQLHHRAVAPGADFAAIARESSEDGSAAAGGDLGEFGRGAMVPPFEEAAFALTANGISDVVESEFGFHVIQRLP